MALKRLEFDKVLIALSNCANTNLGKQRCLQALPFSGAKNIEHQIGLTSFAKKFLDDLGERNFAQLDFIADCETILKAHRLSAMEIFDCAKMLSCSRRTKNALKNTQLSEFRDNLYADLEFEEKIFSIFDSSLNIVESASSQLKSLYQSKRDCEINLKETISKLLSNTNFTNCLQDTIATKRSDRTVFQVIATNKNKISGIVHDVSLSGQTFFIEPKEIVPINNKIKQLESAIVAETERILLDLSSQLHKIEQELITTQNALVEIDFTFAKAKYSILTNSIAPILSKKKIIKIQKMRHPLLIGVVDKIIENDFEIGENYNSLIITGSNTGGKTVVLKTVGLLALMAYSGFHTPALDFEIYPFNKIYADISEEQSLSQSLSTFSAHIKNVASILDNADENSLVLFDELGAGTDPSEGSALARAILEYLNDTITITTTHLGELKLLQYKNSRFKNASVEFDPVSLKPTYRLIIGIAGSSNALLVAKNFNIKPEIISNAKNILNATGDLTSNMLEQIQKTHQSLTKLELEADEKQKTAAETKEQAEKKLVEIKANKKKTLDNFKRKYQNQLEIAREEIKETLNELRAEKSEKVARRAYARLAKLENNARAQFLDDEEKLANKYQPIEDFIVGKSVLIRGLDQIATLLSLPNQKGEVEIQIGLIKSKIKASKLAYTDKKAPKKLQKISVDFSVDNNPLSSLLRLDLRGLRVDEALDILEKHLDLASLKSISEITIIHGHGTGALKSAIRDYLKVSPYVAKFRAGETQSAEGGDGVSIVTLK